MPQRSTCLAFPHSSSLREKGPWKERAFLLAQSLGCPSLPASIWEVLGGAWRLGSLLQGLEMTVPKSLELEESWPWAESREWLKVRRGQGPLQTLKVAGRTAAVSGYERRAWRSAGADSTAGVCPLPHPLGVPGEAEQPEPELVEVEVGSTALLKCGFSHSQGNFSHIDWFSVSAGAPERAAGGGCILYVGPRLSHPLPPPLRSTRRSQHSSSACVRARVRANLGSISIGSASRTKGLLWP